MKRSIPISKLTSKTNSNKKSIPQNTKIFGPNLKGSKPLQVKCGHLKKLIHYDCSKNKENSEDDIPDENEIYVKENLLQNNQEENDNNSPDDDFSIVNINMSRLLSLSNSNSKNTSYNANASKENSKNLKEISKKNNNGSFNKSKGGEISSGNGSIESNNPNNITNNNNSNSNNTNSNSNSNSHTLSNNNNNNNGHLSKNSITAKRKKFYDKLMKKNNNTIINNDKKNQFNEMKNITNNNSASSNIKITNNTNIILNVKSGTKSLDIRALNNNTNNDIMMRDLRQLHIITQKALYSISKINPLLDTLDNYTEANRQRKYSNNKILNNKKPIKELLINDNTDYGINQLLINDLTIDKKCDYNNNPNININFNNNKPSTSQIINIININGGNYSMDQTKKNILKHIPIPRSDLASIEENPYETQYMPKQPNIQRKNIKNKQYNYDTNTFKINKIINLPNKKYSHNDWSRNTINAVSTGGDRKSNKGIKKYIDNLIKVNKGKLKSNINNNNKSILAENNKNKIK